MRRLDAEAVEGAFYRTVVSVPVSTKVPNPRPMEFVRAWRTGGVGGNRILDRPMITVTVTAKSSTRALELANLCRDASLARGAEEITGLYFDPDPDTGDPRYTYTHQRTVRAVQA